MPRCFETFCESGWTGAALQKLVDDVHPQFACETEHCSPFSPGPVNDEEDVAFLLIDPLHYDELRQTIVPDAFQELTRRDLSVLRLQHATVAEVDSTRQELIARGEGRIPPQMRLIDEVCIGSVAELRAATETGRYLAVYDTALDDKRAHASIFVTREAIEIKKARKRARERVHSVMTKRRAAFADFRALLSH